MMYWFYTNFTQKKYSLENSAQKRQILKWLDYIVKRQKGNRTKKFCPENFIFDGDQSFWP